MNNDDYFRLMANPHRLNKKEIKGIRDNTEDLLEKYLKLRYKIYIHSDLLLEIDELIDDRINDYLIKKISEELVERCINNVLEKFEYQIM